MSDIAVSGNFVIKMAAPIENRKTIIKTIRDSALEIDKTLFSMSPFYHINARLL